MPGARKRRLDGFGDRAVRKERFFVSEPLLPNRPVSKPFLSLTEKEGKPYTVPAFCMVLLFRAFYFEKQNASKVLFKTER
jgi:hypothetical protein